jgi:hypothetical protein
MTIFYVGIEVNKQEHRRFYLLLKRIGIIKVRALGMCSPVSLRCLRVWSFQRLGSGGIPAPSAFSRKKHAGAAVSPTAKPLK